MSQTASPSGGGPYGLARVCRVWRAARASVYRHRAPPREVPPRRPGPVGPMPDAELVAAIRAVLAASPFHGEGHRKVWARLRHAGLRTSKRRVLRLMREHGLLAPSRVGSPRGPRAHDGTIVPGTVDTLWGTDLTTTWTGEGQAAVFIALDHCSADCVGIHAALQANRFEALEPSLRRPRQCREPARACGAASAASPRTSPAASPSATTTARSTSATTSSGRSPPSASRARPPSSARPRGTAAPSASSAPSRRTCCGCAPSTPSRNSASHCSSSAKPTTRPG